ncbi:hypothetical protein [Mycobacterium sp. E342]|uniref:hypothetical protein n=1 Tax=Mycobacterium sp. E342 TaxID=1834147 RepID=UPI000B2EB521|nr:hypothetical protein [Mycobacterium sp. E342]
MAGVNQAITNAATVLSDRARATAFGVEKAATGYASQEPAAAEEMAAVTPGR